jgi:hypothetical protein
MDMIGCDDMELYINISKGMHTLNTGKLTRKRVMVKGKNGRTFYRMQWVNPWDASTGHGVRAIHNGKQLDEAIRHGITRQPNLQQHLSHQGIHSTLDLKDKLHFDHPLFLPETEESSQGAMFLANHIQHGSQKYLGMFDNDIYQHSREMSKIDDITGMEEAERMSSLGAKLPSSFLETLDEGSTVDIGWSVSKMNGADMDRAKELAKMTYGEDSIQYNAIKDMEPDPDKQEQGEQKVEHVIEPKDEKPAYGTPEDYRPHYHTHDEKINNMTEWRREATEKEMQGKNKKEAITQSIDFDELESMDEDTVADMLEDQDKYGDLHEQHETAMKHMLNSQLEAAKESAKDVFGELSPTAIEHVFSSPEGKYTAHISSIKPDIMNLGMGKYDVNWSMSIKLKSKDGYHAGNINRTVGRDHDGSLVVHNDLLEVDEDYQNIGIASNVYNRSEQMWKHMAKGNKVKISICANITVGAYAWADKSKGFDFADSYELKAARSELKDFISNNNWDEEEVMQACGYENVDELEHAWEFAELDDGYRYDLTPHAFEDIKGDAHLGKAFMLTSKSSWEAEKHINTDGKAYQEQLRDDSVDDYLADTGQEDLDYEDLEDLDDVSDEELEVFRRKYNE